MIDRLTKIGRNANPLQEPKFCQECEVEKWNGYYFYYDGLPWGFFVCDDCLKSSKTVAVQS